MRRFFRFSVRDMFWLTLVVAVALASGLSAFRYGKEAGRREVAATLEDGVVTKWKAGKLFFFKDGDWRLEMMMWGGPSESDLE